MHDTPVVIFMEDLSNSAKIVDVDYKTTGPTEVVTFIEEQSDSINLGENSSLSIVDHILLPLLNTVSLFVYHATRLLPHEKEGILTSGLQILTEDLVVKKIQEAVNYGYFTKSVGEELRSGLASWDDFGGESRSNMPSFRKSTF